MKGLIFRFEENNSNILKKLFKNIDFNNYDFDIDFFESYEDLFSDMPEDWDFLSDLEEISSTQAKHRILQVDDITAAPEFLELYIRSSNSKRLNISKYNEFLLSDYIMSVLVIDHRNIEICCKNDSWLSVICNNIKELFKYIEIIKVKYLYDIPLEARIRIWAPRDSINIYDS